MTLGPCAKIKVQCYISTKDGNFIVGENICANPQTTCPRTPGEGYLKCHTVCAQLGHAEYVAIRQVLASGYKPADIARISVVGFAGPCNACRDLLDGMGLLPVTNFYPEIHPITLNGGELDLILDAFVLQAAKAHPHDAQD